MCRLLGYVADRPTSVVEVLGDEGFDRFTALTAVHGDGWGMAWQDDAGAIRTTRVPGSASADPAYDDLARRPLGRAGIVHLRWATAGLAATRENTHPFLEPDTLFGPVAFAHNGNIETSDRLEGLLSADSRARLAGETDSERYFRFVLECVEREGDLEGGVVRALDELVRAFPTSSLNALMLTPARIIAVHINSAAATPQRALRDLFTSEEDIPAQHTAEGYYAMDYRVLAGAVHVISSGLDEAGWTPVPSDTAAIVDLESRAITRLPVPRLTR